MQKCAMYDKVSSIQYTHSHTHGPHSHLTIITHSLTVVHPGMTYLFDGQMPNRQPSTNWYRLFDVVICSASKPGFYSGKRREEKWAWGTSLFSPLFLSPPSLFPSLLSSLSLYISHSLLSSLLHISVFVVSHSSLTLIVTESRQIELMQRLQSAHIRFTEIRRIALRETDTSTQVSKVTLVA